MGEAVDDRWGNRIDKKKVQNGNPVSIKNKTKHEQYNHVKTDGS